MANIRGDVMLVVDYGDGHVSEPQVSTVMAPHTYLRAGIYTITVNALYYY